MSTDYLLGKDLAQLQQSICRLEARLNSIELRLPCDSSSSQPEFDPRVSLTPIAIAGAVPPDEKRAEATTATIAWPTTNVHNIRRVPTPDRAAELVFFGFILDIPAYEAQKITDTIWPVVSRMWTDDISLATDYGGYRPTGFRGAYCCVIGFYSRNLNWWNWIAIAYQHVQDNPNARFSKAYNMNGDLISGTAKNGWDPDVILSAPADEKYKVNARYADADTEWGVHFYFHSLRT